MMRIITKVDNVVVLIASGVRQTTIDGLGNLAARDRDLVL